MNMFCLEMKILKRALFCSLILLLNFSYSLADVPSIVQSMRSGQSSANEAALALLDELLIGKIEPIEVAKVNVGLELKTALADSIVVRARELLLDTLELSPEIKELKTLFVETLGPTHPTHEKLDRLLKQTESLHSAIRRKDFEASDRVEQAVVLEDEKRFFEIFSRALWREKLETITSGSEKLSAYARAYPSKKPEEFAKFAEQYVKDKAFTWDSKAVEYIFKLASEKHISKPLTADYFSEFTKFALKNKKPELARNFYGKVLRLRPDFHPKNTELRSDVIPLAIENNAKAFAFGRVEELVSKEGLDFKTRFYLFRKGFYGEEVRLWIFLISLLMIMPAIILLIAKIAFPKKKSKLKRAPSGSSSEVEVSELDTEENLIEENKPPEEPPPEKKVKKKVKAKPASSKKREDSSSGKGYMNASSRGDEYSRLLAVFQLDDEASEADIKKAFRTKIKEYHPDISELEVQEAQKKTDELKLVYDRLMEIRGSWFGGGR